MSIRDSVAEIIEPRAWKSSQIGSSCSRNPASNASVWSGSTFRTMATVCT